MNDNNQNAGADPTTGVMPAQTDPVASVDTPVTEPMSTEMPTMAPADEAPAASAPAEPMAAAEDTTKVGQ